MRAIDATQCATICGCPESSRMVGFVSIGCSVFGSILFDILVYMDVVFFRHFCGCSSGTYVDIYTILVLCNKNYL